MPDIYLGQEGEDVKPAQPTEPTSSAKDIKDAKIAELVPPTPKGSKITNIHFLSSYGERPSYFKFADKLDNEEILLFLRRHFVTNVPWILKATFLLLIPLVFYFVSFFQFFSFSFLPTEYILLILIFYYFLVSGYIFVNYLSWFYNISLVTTDRIIDIDFSNVVFENVAATKLSQVEDVSYSQIGVIRSVFDYGNVTVQTAGTLSEFVFSAVPHPERVIKIINNLIGEANNA